MRPTCLLIAPTKYFYKEVPSDTIKHHLLALMSHLAETARVELVDLENLFGYPQSETEIEDFLRGAERQLAGLRPDVIGVSCYTSYDYLSSVDVLRLCDRLFPDAIKVVGGYHPTAVPADFTDRDVPVDLVVRGEGEIVLERVVAAGVPPDTPVVDGPPLDLREERPLRYDLYPYRSDDICLALSRGCPFQCTFCVQSDDFPNRYRRLELEQIREKLRRAAAHLPLQRIMFVDPFFGVQRRHTLELLDLLSEEFSHLHYWAETRIDCVRPEWLEKLAGLQLDLHFGVESLAEDTIRLMNKARDPAAYVESFQETLDLCQRWQVLARCGFIMNYPGEHPESTRATLGRIEHEIERSIEHQGRLWFTFHCNQYALYPGNTIYDRRHELHRERGFSFPNDGWWRKRGPQARRRSEQCLASAAMVREHGENPGFWKGEVLTLLKRCSAKYDLEAFRFYRKTEVLQSLRDHYPDRRIDEWSLEPCRVQFDLVSHLRHRLTDIYYRYDRWLANAHPGKEQSFLGLYNLVTLEYQRKLLTQFDEGADLDELRHGVDVLHRQLTEELERNMSDGAGNGATALDLDLMGQRYRLDVGDRIYRLESAAQGGAT